MKKAILFMIIIMGVFMSGCSNAEQVSDTLMLDITPVKTPEITESPTPQAENKESELLDHNLIVVPKLYIEYNGQLYQAVNGTCSLYLTAKDGRSVGFEGDTMPPEFLVESQKEPINIIEGGYVKFVFDTAPSSYQVQIWNKDDYNASPLVKVTDNKISVAQNQDTIIYYVTAKFSFLVDDYKESGTVYYSFVIN